MVIRSSLCVTIRYVLPTRLQEGNGVIIRVSVYPSGMFYPRDYKEEMV